MGGTSTRRTRAALAALVTTFALSACGASGTAAPATSAATTAYQPLFAETVATTAAPTTVAPAAPATTLPPGTTFAAADGTFDLTVPEAWIAVRPRTQDEATWAQRPMWAVGRQTGDFAPFVAVSSDADTATSIDDLVGVVGDEFQGMTVEESMGFPTYGDRVLAYTTVVGNLPTTGFPAKVLIVADLAEGRSVTAVFGAPPDQYEELLNAVGPYLLTLHAR